MRVAWRAVVAAVLAATLGGCTQAWMFEDLPGPSSPVTTPVPATTPELSATSTASPTPTTDPVREQFPYRGALAEGSCVTASRDLLDDLEAVGGVGGAITYQRGALVKADGPWWTIAVAPQVNPNDEGLTHNDVDPAVWFVSNGPSVTAGDPVSTWPLNPDPDDEAADRALTCLGLVPAPPPEPPESSPASYTGRLARDAGCVAAGAPLLKHLEGVGRVGGAITYPRGQLVKANRNWWTVAVATQVHPNNLGHTRDNVPEVVYFVTNAPSRVSPQVSFILEEPAADDTAAPAARHCLTG